MPSDELIGDVVQVIAYDVRLWANPQNVVSGTFDQSGLPAGRDGAENVPCVAGYKTELGRLNSELAPYAITRPMAWIRLQREEV